KVVSSHRAYIYGELYDLPLSGYPGAIHGIRKVYGFVMSFNDITILQELDKLEDYDPRRQPVENDYNRELVITYPLNGNSITLAWAYFMTPDRIQQLGGILLSDGWW
ncbi:MAG: gamma-glutamylcyclotransferase, partial [Chamaesiphon sp.]|nr:gamma-glutamylcyclotransferase [Chamaesiphon sp.]